MRCGQIGIYFHGLCQPTSYTCTHAYTEHKHYTSSTYTIQILTHLELGNDGGGITLLDDGLPLDVPLLGGGGGGADVVLPVLTLPLRCAEFLEGGGTLLGGGGGGWPLFGGGGGGCDLEGGGTLGLVLAGTLGLVLAGGRGGLLEADSEL